MNPMAAAIGVLPYLMTSERSLKRTYSWPPATHLWREEEEDCETSPRLPEDGYTDTTSARMTSYLQKTPSSLSLSLDELDAASTTATAGSGQTEEPEASTNTAIESLSEYSNAQPNTVRPGWHTAVAPRKSHKSISSYTLRSMATAYEKKSGFRDNVASRWTRSVSNLAKGSKELSKRAVYHPKRKVKDDNRPPDKNLGVALDVVNNSPHELSSYASEEDCDISYRQAHTSPSEQGKSSEQGHELNRDLLDSRGTLQDRRGAARPTSRWLASGRRRASREPAITCDIQEETNASQDDRDAWALRVQEARSNNALREFERRSAPASRRRRATSDPFICSNVQPHALSYGRNRHAVYMREQADALDAQRPAV